MTQHTNTLLASLVEKMEKKRRKVSVSSLAGRLTEYALVHNAAIDQCITIIKQAMK